jgi:DNA integrity scanning protein DisA with diadenylate cyclase activity
MASPLYAAARSAAPGLVDYFARHAAAGPAHASSGAGLPDVATVEALIDAAFWASLQREEGYAPEISLAYLPPERAVRPLMLAAPMPLSPRALGRLAPAVERPGIHLGVWRDQGALRVWGTTRAIPTFCFVLEVLGPGLLVVKHRVQDDSAKFRNVAVFEGEEVKVLSREDAHASDHPALLRSLLAPESADGVDDSADVLIRLAVSMRAHRRGGTLLVVPAATEAWRESIVQPVAYSVDPAFTELRDLVLEDTEEDPLRGHEALGRVVDAVAGLTAVDGATVISDRYEVLGFGVKIRRPDGRSQVEQVVMSEPVEGGAATVVAPLQLGGTRHSSAAQFAQDQHDAVALVASQDGRFTIFAWSPREGMVHAHRVETLLM